MPLPRLSLLSLMGFLFAATAQAEEGKVVIVEPGCPHFVVKMSDGFIIYEHLMGPHPTVGDVIEGDHSNRPGGKMINITAGGAAIMLYREAGPIAERRIEEKTPYKCKVRRPKPKMPGAAPTEELPAASSQAPATPTEPK